MKGSIGKKFLTGIWLSLFHGNVCHLGDIHISVFLWHILFDMGFLCDAVILSGAKKYLSISSRYQVTDPPESVLRRVWVT